MTLYPLYINGEFKETKNREKVISPSTGEVIAEVAVASDADIESALSSSRIAFDNSEWRHLSFEKRKDLLLNISQGIFDRAAELARLETLNTGKPIKETTFMDIPSSARTFEYFANNLENYLKSEKIEVSEQPAKAQLIRQPHGVAVLIVPWNYPLLIASWKMAQALAAGNCIILKPSSLTPLSALELAKIVEIAGFPKGTVNIINGSGAKLGEKLCADKRVDMVSFTGSNETGRQIVQYASKNVKKVIMELGGKSAAVVLKDADLETAVNGLLCSIFLNQGQMCTAMSRIFVDDEIYPKFITDFTEKAKRIKLGDGLEHETQMGPLISAAQRKKVAAYVEKGIKEGARLLCGGAIPRESSLKAGFFFEPTVFTEVERGMSIFQEEIFGPVACISRFGSIDEAIELANSSEFGLACSVWSKDAETAQDVAARINAGTAWVNTYGMFYNELPYGGLKQSGFGKELGREGFLEYTCLKNIIIDHSAQSKPLVSYWYGF